MASLFKRGDAWAIQFDDPDGERRTLGLGRLPATAARTIAAHVEHLAGATIARTAPPPETSKWLADIGDTLRDKLAAVGLAARRDTATLGEFAARYRKTRPDWGVSMGEQYDLAVKDAKAFFGETRRLSTITPADGDGFRAHLAARLALATARKRMRFLKHLLRFAVRSKILQENPLEDQRTFSGPNRERMQYVPAAAALAVADELTGETRLTFLLARFAGLRVVSETHALSWSHVDFERETLRIFAPKTQRTRTVPMLPAVRAVLLKAFNEAPDGAEHVFRKRSPLPVCRRGVERAIVRAGVAPWPKIMQQLRASFATDCVRALPANAAAEILGHSLQVAAAHYWTADSTDLQRAAQALHNIAEWRETAVPDGKPKRAKTANKQALCGMERNSLVGQTGFEPVLEGF